MTRVRERGKADDASERERRDLNVREREERP